MTELTLEMLRAELAPIRSEFASIQAELAPIRARLEGILVSMVRAPANDLARANVTPGEAQAPEEDVKKLLTELAARVETLEREMAELKAML